MAYVEVNEKPIRMSVTQSTAIVTILSLYQFIKTNKPFQEFSSFWMKKKTLFYDTTPLQMIVIASFGNTESRNQPSGKEMEVLKIFDQSDIVRQ